MLALHTFGDSILDCAVYNAHGVHPGALLVRNDDRLFPEFTGQDLKSHGGGHLHHAAEDGATVERLARQAEDLRVVEPAIALLTVGGNDLMGSRAIPDSGSSGSRGRSRISWSDCRSAPCSSGTSTIPPAATTRATSWRSTSDARARTIDA